MNEHNNTRRYSDLWVGIIFIVVAIILIVYLFVGRQNTQNPIADNSSQTESQLDQNLPASTTPPSTVPSASNTGTGNPIKVTKVATTVTCTDPELCNVPVISGILVTKVTTSGATISWTTDSPATTQIFYSTSTLFSHPGNTMTIDDPTLSKTHQIDLGHLNSDTLYNYMILSGKVSGIVATSTARFFKTLMIYR